MEPVMRLFHFTAGEWLRGIAQHGLTVGDVPTDHATLAGTVGVWFTTSEKPEGHGLGGLLDKKRFRLTVEVPTDNLHRWTDWADQHVTLQTRIGLHRASGAAHDTWHIYFGRIAPERILEVRDMQTGTVVPDWQTVWLEGKSLPGVRYEARFIWQQRMIRDVRNALKQRKQANA